MLRSRGSKMFGARYCRSDVLDDWTRATEVHSGAEAGLEAVDANRGSSSHLLLRSASGSRTAVMSSTHDRTWYCCAELTELNGKTQMAYR